MNALMKLWKNSMHVRPDVTEKFQTIWNISVTAARKKNSMKPFFRSAIGRIPEWIPKCVRRLQMY